MDSTVFVVQLLYAALAIIMVGLGLSLRVADFARLKEQAWVAGVLLVLQMLILPVIAIALNELFGVHGYLAVGIILLAATPGSVTANLFSHLFGGDVAFNVALTGVNTFLCALTLPLLGSWALAHYVGDGKVVPILLDNALRTIAIVVVPVLIGMVTAAKAPAVAGRLQTPVKILSALLLVVFSVGAIVKEWATLVGGFAQVGNAILAFNAICLVLGFVAGWVATRDRRIATTGAFQASIHNAIQAIYIGLAVLGVPAAALPAAVYSITMNIFAVLFGVAVSYVWPRAARQPLAST